jgi:hypothetical protein
MKHELIISIISISLLIYMYIILIRIMKFKKLDADLREIKTIQDARRAGLI